MCPVRGTRPEFGLIPAMPVRWAGALMLPPVSLPTSNGEPHAETIAAAPPLEPPGERYNHSSIYKVRPEINAVVHCHPIISTAFTIANRDIIPVGRFGGCFHPKVPVYPKSIQVETQEIGDEIAEVLGDAPAVMLKHHGAACVGKTIEQAVAVAITLEDTARFLQIASTLGTPQPLPLDEIGSDKALKLDRPSFSSNPWIYWAEQVEKGI